MSKKPSPWLDTELILKGGKSERRTTTRYKAVDPRCRLGWWDGPQFREVPAAMLNVSMRGALVTCGVAPPEDLPTWLLLEGNAEVAWFQAQVVKVSRPKKAAPEIALEFCSSCPYESFKAAAFGPDVFPNAAPTTWEAVGEDNETRNWW